ncbi:hypothetical protein FMGBMHLM_3139 [Methylobacterium aerolatum]|nr:hypothetical protein FMGBMHLM_3139 [Methylobacterium aerolatum]
MSATPGDGTIASPESDPDCEKVVRSARLPLYFAYGANMDAAAMALRCPVSRLIGRGRLPRHRFIIMREGYASVVRDPARTVHGVVWDLAPDDIPALDRYEGVASGLYAKAALPVTTAVGTRKALIYLGRSTAPGRPRPGYLDAVLAAGAAAQLPAPYLREVSGWLRGPPA